MADDPLGLADLVLINDRNLSDIDVTDLLDDAPLLAAITADVASNGTDHKYLVETGPPTVGFRAPNAGREHDSSEDTLTTINLKILDASFTVDVALADSYKNGRDALIAKEARRHLKAAFFKAEQQFILGTTDGDAAGFSGLNDSANMNALADTLHVVNAGGSTADTSSDVYLLRAPTDNSGIAAIIGQSGQINVGDTAVQRVEDGSSLHYPAYHTPVTGWLAMQLGSAYDAVRIVNVTEDAGDGITDDRIYEALALFPASRQPNWIVMSRRSLKQLRDSRTATNATGAPAPRPADVDGYPIIVTDAIPVTSALTT